jgi:hypothetical protein
MTMVDEVDDELDDTLAPPLCRYCGRCTTHDGGCCSWAAEDAAKREKAVRARAARMVKAKGRLRV